MPAWKSKRVQKQKKNKRWERDSKSKSKSRKRDSIKKHYTRKASRTSRSNRDEFSKFLKSKAKNEKKVWKPKTKRKKVNSPKSVKKTKKNRWAHDWNIDALLDVSDDSIERYRKKANKSDESANVVGLPNWPPKGPSPSKMPSPHFSPKMSVKPDKSPSPSPVNFTDIDMKVIKTVLEDVFKPSPEKPKLLRPIDLLPSKKNSSLRSNTKESASGIKKNAGVRLRTPQHLFEEVAFLKANYKIDSFYFIDDLSDEYFQKIYSERNLYLSR